MNRSSQSSGKAYLIGSVISFAGSLLLLIWGGMLMMAGWTHGTQSESQILLHVMWIWNPMGASIATSSHFSMLGYLACSFVWSQIIGLLCGSLFSTQLHLERWIRSNGPTTPLYRPPL